MKNNKLVIILCAAIAVSISSLSFAAQKEVLGDSKDLGLGNTTSKSTPKGRAKQPEEKISHLGDGAYIRQFNDFGQPTVEVHPESGPSYYYNENQIQEPNPEDGVRWRDTPAWQLGQW